MTSCKVIIAFFSGFSAVAVKGGHEFVAWQVSGRCRTEKTPKPGKVGITAAVAFRQGQITTA